MSLTIHVATMAAAGFLLHFLSRWGEFWRTHSKLSPIKYAALDPPAWAFAALATVVGVPVVGLLLPIDPATIPDADARQKFEMLAALSLGFNASSLAAKLPSLAAPSRPPAAR